MALDLRIKRERARWYDLKPQADQLRLISEQRRFKVVPAGRRSGKTERAKRYWAKKAMLNPGRRYFLAAPTRDQAAGIWWADMRKLCYESLQRRRPSESKLIIFLNNGASIHILGLDKPERIEGQLWHGGCVDEIGNCKEEAWPMNIKPALDTINPEEPDFRAECWLIGVPEGMNHYYKLAQYAELSGDPEWGYYHWKSAEVLPQDVIDAAKRSMSAREFRQEYEASFETASGKIYADYNKENYTKAEILPNEVLLWYHDFNYTPMSSGIGVIRENKEKAKRKEIFLLDEIILTSAISRQSAEEFCDKFKKHQNKRVIIYGDPAGRAGEKHGHSSDYTEIENVLRMNGWTYERRVKNAAPAIKDRQNAVRAKIANAAGDRVLFVNPAKAPYTHEGLATVQFKEGSTFLEEVSKYQHITTAIGYFIDYEFPIPNRLSTIQLAGV